MSDVAIHVERVGKRYRLGSRAPHQERFGEWLIERLVAPLRRAARAAGGRAEPDPPGCSTFWALKDVSFRVGQGEVVGVIGHNGAGKSTLLKILSRITEPTSGYADVWGRVSSLLEVGTGFHPELTGRENIYLNGGILGLRRADIDARFDSIVAFAEIEPFVDTPVKHYSSGMYVRLAFAVAAHLEPDILLVDEILAVGDLAFQRKCLSKMDDISRQGRTVLVVSHNMNVVRRLCARSILLDRGSVKADGPTADVLEEYFRASTAAGGAGEWIGVHREHAGGSVRVEAVSFSSPMPQSGMRPCTGGPLDVVLDVVSGERRDVDSVAVSLFDRYGTKLVNADTLSIGRPLTLAAGHTRVHLRVEALHLNPGAYTLGVWIANPPHEVFAALPNVALVEVVETEAQRIRVRDDGVVACQFDLVDASTWAGALAE